MPYTYLRAPSSSRHGNRRRQSDLARQHIPSYTTPQIRAFTSDDWIPSGLTSFAFHGATCMGSPYHKLLKSLHQSGFPVQIGVRKEIERAANEHDWEVTAEEYHWAHRANGKSGFIDLIVEHER